MMTTKQYLAPNGNLSCAWAESFLRLMQRGVSEISPLVVTVTNIVDGIVQENTAIRTALDRRLRELGCPSVHTVANTIFPESLWNPNTPNNADALFERFRKAWPRIERCPANNRGSYFQRLTAYQPIGVAQPVNQLKHIIETYRSGNHRRSALQASVFDPTRDHNDCRRLGFPCLQQVAFAPLGHEGLVVTGFYATQFILERGYGNYLGLCRLGRFVAQQIGRKLERMVCVASIAQRGLENKSTLQPLADDLDGIISSMGVCANAK